MEQSAWRFAKTYVESYPHEYTLERDTNQETLARAVECIDPTLINRTWLDVSRYRTKAQALGYDGARLNALVERWKLKLAESRRV